VLEPWAPRDRVAFVAPDPVADLPRLAGPVLAWTQRFYDREIAREDGFFDYPRHFVIGGEPGACPRVLGPYARPTIAHPSAQRGWGPAEGQARKGVAQGCAEQVCMLRDALAMARNWRPGPGRCGAIATVCDERWRD
jgi:hypothetical protein